MKRGYTIALLVLLVLGSFMALGADLTPEDDLDQFGPNPFHVPTPSGTSVQVRVYARYAADPPLTGGFVPGVTVTMADSSGATQEYTTPTDIVHEVQQQEWFTAIVGQQYFVTASYGPSVVTATVTITSFGDAAVLTEGPLGGGLAVTVRAAGGEITALAYRASHTNSSPDPREYLPTPVGTPVPVGVGADYIDRAAMKEAGPVAGMGVAVLSESQVVFAGVTDEFGRVARGEEDFELLAGHEYTVVVEWEGSTTSTDFLVTSIGPSRKYAIGGGIGIQVDRADNSIIDIKYYTGVIF